MSKVKRSAKKTAPYAGKKTVSAKKGAASAKKTAASHKKAATAAKKKTDDAQNYINTQIGDDGFVQIVPEDIKPLPPGAVEEIIEWIRSAMAEFRYVSDENLTPLQRRRKTGAGVKNYGFIDKVSDLAAANPQYVRDFKINDLKNAIRNIEICRDIVAMLDGFRRMVSNSSLVYSTDAYRMALIFYNTVQTLAQRGDPLARGLFDMLRPFFVSRGKHAGKQTAKQLKRDVTAVSKGKKEGRIVIEHEDPHVTGGKHIVIDETQKKKAKFKEIVEEEIDE